MAADKNDWFALASLERVRRLDAVCRRFEEAWRDPTAPPRLEDFLPDAASADDAEQGQMLRELIATEIELRQARGLPVDPAEYLRRFPDRAAILAEVFGDTLSPNANDTVRVPGIYPAGATIGPYGIVREIGRGGMGVVYEAVHESLNRRVALKVLPAHPLRQSEQLRRFRREARTLARLQHPAIVTVFDTGEQEGVNYLAMRYVDGRNLDQMLKELRAGKPVELGARTLHGGTADYFRVVGELGLAVAEALAHAHGEGILHRDIKPSNLLADGAGAVWVTDFGLAKGETDAGTLTGTDQIVGTPRYLPPEAFEGRWDARSDVYSLGATLYEMLTLRPAFPATKQHELIHQILHADPVRPGAIEPGIPRDLEAIVLRSLRRRPEERFASAGEMAADLGRYLRNQGRRKKRSFSVGAALTAIMPVLLVLTLAGLWLGDRESRTRGVGTDAIARDELPGLVPTPARLPGGLRWQMVRASPTRIECLAWDRSGQFLAVGENEGVVRILDGSVDPPVPMRVLLGNKSAVLAVSWSPSGRFASTGADSTVRVWDADGRPTATLEGHQAVVRSLDWNAEETQIVSGGGDRTIRLWDLATGQATVLHRDLDGEVIKVAWTPGGTHLIAVSGQCARVWDKSGLLVHQFDHGHRVRTAAISPSRDAIATSGLDGRVKLWRIGRKEPEAVFEAHTGCLAWDADGDHLVAVTDKAPAKLTRCRLDGSEQEILAAGPLGPVTCMDWSAAGPRLALGGRDGALRVWAKTGLRDLLPGVLRDELGCSVGWTSGGRLVTTNPAAHSWAADGASAAAPVPGLILGDLTANADGVRLAGFNPATQEVQLLAADGKVERSFAARSLQFAPDAQRYCMLNAEATELAVKHLDGAAGPKLVLGPRGFWISGIAWHPQGQAIALTKLGTVHLWDLQNPAAARLIANLGTESVGAPAWSPDGTWLAASNTNRILLFDAAGKPALQWTAQPGAITHMTWSPDNRWLASSSGEGRCLRLWNAHGEAGPMFSAPALGLRRIAWSNHGLAGINHTGDVFVWNYADGVLRPAWCGFILDEQPATFDAAGKVRLGDAALIEKHFLFVAENEKKILEPLRFAEFRRRYPGVWTSEKE